MAQTKKTTKKQAKPKVSATKQKTTGKTKKAAVKPYRNALEYLEDVLSIFTQEEVKKSRAERKAAILAILDKIERRLAHSTADIPFEKELKKYPPLTPIEKYCVYWIVRERLFGGPRSKKSLYLQLLISGLCSEIDAMRVVVNNDSALYKICTFDDHMYSKMSDLNNLLMRGPLELIDAQKPDVPKEAQPKPPASETKEAQKQKDMLQSPVSICQALEPYIVGQQEAKEGIATAIYEHFLRCRLLEKGNLAIDKNNVLLWGPTGTGKTYLCRTLANVLDIPLYIADASGLVDTGYVGTHIQDVIYGAARRIPKMEKNKFPPSIIYLDEIDKICFKGKKGGTDVSGKGVQEELLKLLESTHFAYLSKRDDKVINFDISNVMFMAGGAFEGLDKIIAERLRERQLGFVRCETKKGKKSVSVKDLEQYGFMPELLGRFTKWLTLHELTEQDLVDILSKSKNNPISQYKEIFKEAGVELIIPQETIMRIAHQALKNGTGARGLKNVLSVTLGKALMKCKKEKLTQFTLTSENI